MLINNHKQFLDEMMLLISKKGIGVLGLEMDHIAYQASSNKDYDSLAPEFVKMGEMVSEVVVGGRRVGIFRFEPKLEYKDYLISAIELIAPKDKQDCPSALEHVEFVTKESFESFMQ